VKAGSIQNIVRSNTLQTTVKSNGRTKNIIIKMIGILNRKLFFEIIELPINYNPAICRVVNLI
tara:strand:+ start:28 stop:216 length:189 start_codon:yes stop_codon:yes gene_type:complete